MHIYIDESGTFTIPLLKTPAISCVVALVIPDAVHDEMLSGFEDLIQSLGLDIKSVKGRELHETHIAAIVRYLNQFDVILEVTAIEMAMQTVTGIYHHKQRQAHGLITNLNDTHLPSLVADMTQWRDKVMKLPNQLYTQAVCMWELVAKTIQKSTLYYAQRHPQELGSFHWFIDAKDKSKMSAYDDLWSTLVMPVLQSRSFREPFIQLVEGDYRYFDRFCGSKPETPRHLIADTGLKSPFDYVDMKSVLHEHLSVATAADCLGLRLVDVIANALRRSMNGNLQRAGWDGLAVLMVQSERRAQVINLIDLSTEPRPKFARDPAYYQVIPHCEAYARPLLLPGD